MKLDSFLTADRIILSVACESKDELITTAATLLRERENPHFPYSEKEIEAALREREEQVSTGMGQGIAIPHARLPELKNVHVILFRTAKGIDFGSPDNMPVDLVAAVLIPGSEPARGLKVMAQIARLFMEQGQAVRSAKSSRQIARLIEEGNLLVEEPILARDIMVEPPCVATAETSLQEITRNMATHHTYAVPVVDSENRLIGQVTCGHLFSVGLPDFFKKLKSVSFVSYFDPFAEYFRQEANATAGDIMQRVEWIFTKENTILEIVFALTVKNSAALFVVDEEQKLIGMISPETVMNQVINY